MAGVATDLGLILHVGVDFRMVDVPTLNALRTSGKASPPDQGTDTNLRTLGLYVRKGHTRVIYMLHGVPRLIFRTTVAHEYAHAWQTEYCPLLQDEVLREGFAEWVAYQHLIWLGATRAAERMLVAHHPYRPFFDHVLRMEQQLGRDGLIRTIQQAE